MVGRKYRDRCLECQRRRVKCSGEKPQCLRCSIHNTICPGYGENGYSWISSSERNGNQDLALSKEPRQGQKDDRHLINASGSKYVRGKSLLNKRLPRSPNQAHVNLQQMLSCFLTGCLPTNEHLGFKYCSGSSRFLYQLPSIAYPTQMIVFAMRALSLAHAGRIEMDERLMSTGRQCYAEVMKLLRIEAANRNLFKDMMHLATINVIAFYECYDSPLSECRGFMKHVMATESLLRNGLPLSLLDQSSLLCFRTLAIYNSFGTRRQSFLEKYQRQLPSAGDDSDDSSYLLEDITICIPSLLEEADGLQAPENTEAADYQKFCDNFISFDRRLLDWFKSCTEKAAGLLWYQSSQNYANEPIERLLFPNFGCGQTMIHYWSSKIILYSAACQALRIKINENSDDTPDETEEHEQLNHIPLSSSISEALSVESEADQHNKISQLLSSKPRECLGVLILSMNEYAKAVCQSLPFMLDRKMGTIGCLRAINALWITIQFLKDGDRDDLDSLGLDKREALLELCMDACRQIDERGLNVGQIGQNITKDEWRSMSIV